MTNVFKSVALAAFCAGLAATPALAGPHHHRHVSRAAPAGPGYDPRDYNYAPPYGGYYGSNGWEANAVAAATARAYREPGLTLELAPDAKLTATGGPSGGVPGFSSH